MYWTRTRLNPNIFSTLFLQHAVLRTVYCEMVYIWYTSSRFDLVWTACMISHPWNLRSTVWTSELKYTIRLRCFMSSCHCILSLHTRTDELIGMLDVSQTKQNIFERNKTESHYRSARLVQAFKILEFKMMLRFNESCHWLLSGSFILLNWT